MPVKPLDAPADQVNLPLGHGVTVTVAEATDEDLGRQLADSLVVIAETLSRVGWTPTKDGQCPDGWFDHANANRHLHSEESVTRRHERLIRTIRREQAERAARDKAKRQAEKADARARLERLVKEGPEQAQKICDAIEYAAQETRVVWHFVRALQVMGGSQHLVALHSDLERAIHAAADALGVDRPSMPYLEPADVSDMPRTGDVSEALAILSGRGGFSQIHGLPPGFDLDADALARKLKA